MSTSQTAEHLRLADAEDDRAPWRLWGPYLSGRQWGTVREDYSANGDAWASFGFDQAHLRAYRWGEDGIAGLCDRTGFLNLAVALWNGRDDRLKERWFGLTNAQGNHGEDVKEYWWHLDATPTHSYAQSLYRYPHKAFPYEDLIRTNAQRSRNDPEYELSDTGILAEDRFFDVVVTHAKSTPHDILIDIEATNHGPEPAPLDLIPQLWFRNTWAWGRDNRYPSITVQEAPAGQRAVRADHDFLGTYYLTADGEPELLFCDNETNYLALWGDATHQPEHPKNAVDAAVVHADRSMLADGHGTKVALHWHFDQVPSRGSVRVRLRLRRDSPGGFAHFDDLVTTRREQADAFYGEVIHADPADAAIARRAFAGLMWCKQHYRYDVRAWLEGDPTQPPPPPQRRDRGGRNVAWQHLSLADVISMPDEWEYPWFAAWDLAFHCVALAHVDPYFAKQQLLLMCREWSMHPDGQIPAYEWKFGDVNPPVHAWAAWQVYCLDGRRDTEFLVRIMTKLLLNFGWWINRKDADGSNLFEGGFLGMDNISVFDRSAPLPVGETLEQSDATSWIAFFDLCMLRLSWELARHDHPWDDIATKFLEHYLSIAQAMENFGPGSISLWDDEDGFFYDTLVHADGRSELIKVRSLVGLLPLLAVAIQPEWVTVHLPDYVRRLDWLHRHRPGEVTALIKNHTGEGPETLSLLPADRLERVAARLLDPDEFWSDHGVRSLSGVYRDGAQIDVGGTAMPIRYVPGASDSAMFGGNSNWRGPVWLCINALLVDALRVYDEGLGVEFEYPVGSGRRQRAAAIADDLTERLVSLFRTGPDGRRPSDPRDHLTGPLWESHPTFSEYFDGDTGAGLGASHQTGWTALVAHLICCPTGPAAAPPGPAAGAHR